MKSLLCRQQILKKFIKSIDFFEKFYYDKNNHDVFYNFYIQGGQIMKNYFKITDRNDDSGRSDAENAVSV